MINQIVKKIARLCVGSFVAIILIVLAVKILTHDGIVKVHKVNCEDDINVILKRGNTNEL